MRLGLHRRHRLDEVAAAVEGELRLDGLDGQRAAVLAAGLQRRRRRPRGRERLGPRLLRVLGAGEDPVHAVVVQALVGADERAIEGRLDGLRAAQLELDGHRQAVDVRAQRAGVVRQRLGQHRLDRARHVDRGRAPVGLAVDRRAGAHVGRDVGDVDPDAPVLVAERLARDRVVEVAGGDGVDGEGRQVREVAAGDVGRADVLGGALDPCGERAPQATIEHQRLDDVPGDVRAPEHAGDLVAPALGVGMQQSQAPGARVARALDRHPAAAPEERLADEEAAALLEQDDARWGVGQDGHLAPATAIARSSPSSVFVLGSSLARTSGMIPLPVETPLPPRLRPLGVKY